MKRSRHIGITLAFLLAFSVSPFSAHAQMATVESNPLTLAHYLTTSVKSTVTAANSAISAAAEKSLWAKEFAGDPAVYALGQAAIKSITNSTVRWINSGFQGSPAYVTDLKSTMLDAADQQAAKFVSELRKQDSINSPFRDKLAKNLLAAYYLSTSKDGFFLMNPYTLNQVSSDDRAFLKGDFTKGGFQAWFSATLNQQNNPLTASDLAQDQLDSQLSALASQIHEELGWGNGILSWRKCDDPPASTSGSVNLTPSKTCFSSHIETPGTVIAGQLNHALGLGTDSLVSADEIDEVVGALMGQLMNHVLGSDGLGGLSRPSGVSGGRAYFQQSDPAVNSTVPATSGSNSTGTTGSGTASGTTSVVTSFLQILQNQSQQLQTYMDNWQKINTAATAAKSALTASTCVPDAQTIITTDVQPVITQAATVVGTVPGQLSALDKIRTEALSAITQTGSQQAAGLAQANTDYQTFLSSNTLPSAQDFAYAVDQSQETASDQSASLVTKMNGLTAQAKQCSQ
ncbi:MAG: hypothetical protein ACM3TU_00895 [Bacillota bacterium]